MLVAVPNDIRPTASACSGFPGLGHFRLGTSCLQTAKGCIGSAEADRIAAAAVGSFGNFAAVPRPLEALPMEQRIEEAEVGATWPQSLAASR